MQQRNRSKIIFNLIYNVQAKCTVTSRCWPFVLVSHLKVVSCVRRRRRQTAFDFEAFRVTSLILETKIADDQRQSSYKTRTSLATSKAAPPPSLRSRPRQDETPLKASTAYDVLVIIGWLGYSCGQRRAYSKLL